MGKDKSQNLEKKVFRCKPMKQMVKKKPNLE